MKVRNADRKTWRHFVEHCPGATFFHTPEWYELWATYLRQKVALRLLEWRERPPVLLPLLVGRALKGLARAYVSAPVGTYGGCLCTEPLVDQQGEAVARYLAGFPMLSLCDNPYDSSWSGALDWTGEDATQVIDLDVPPEQQLVRWSSHHRRALRKAQGFAWELSQAHTEAEWRAYFELYRQSVRRWGTRASNSYRWPLFVELRALPPERCRLWLAGEGGQIRAGALCFYLHDRLIYWHGATAAEALPKNPGQWLHYQIICQAQAAGYRYVDLGPSAGLEGVEAFKKGFGARRLTFGRLEKQSPAIHFLSKISNTFRLS